MVSPLLFVLSTFLMSIGLSSFYSLNLCFAAVLFSMNIPVTLLSKSTFTIIPSCISIFSILIFNYTSLSILKVLLTFFWLLPSLTVLFGSPAYAPLSSLPSSDIYTIFAYSWSLPAFYFLLYDIPSLHTFYTAHTLLLLPLCTTLILIGMFSPVLLCHNTPLLSSSTLSLNSSFILAIYYKWSLTICDGCFDTLKSSKMQS